MDGVQKGMKLIDPPCWTPQERACVFKYRARQTGHELIVRNCCFINTANGGIGPDVFDDLQAFFHTLLMAKVAEAKAPLLTSCICYGSGKCAWVAHFCEECCSSRAL